MLGLCLQYFLFGHAESFFLLKWSVRGEPLKLFICLMGGNASLLNSDGSGIGMTAAAPWVLY
jgi:hypothetical protein